MIKETNNIDKVLNEISSSIIENLNIFTDLYVDTFPKIIKRKIRYKNKFKYRYILIYNPIHDLLPNPRTMFNALKYIINNEKTKI